jgi:hypothetical protein
MGTNLYRLYVYHLKHFFLYNFQDKNTRKTFKCLLDVTLFHRKRQDHQGGQIR